VYGDGSSRRDYTYVDDIVAGIRAALTYDRSAYEVINLGNSSTVTLRDMIRKLESGLRLPAVIEWQPDQPGDVPQTWASVAKAQALLGYEPRRSFDEGIGRFVEWFSSVSMKPTINPL
jgi:UDP-glucuronate 4-epimerase